MGRISLCLVVLSAACLANAPPSMSAETPVLPQQCGLYAYKAEITDVYDGDTVTADVDLGFNTWRRGERLRLWGIDAPELRGDSREAGLSARDALRARVLGREVIICTIRDRTGKYGRYLTEIHLDGENINDWMIRAGHATPYEERVGNAVQGALWPVRGRDFVYAPFVVEP